MTSNPYAPPTVSGTSGSIRRGEQVAWRRGPAWYIVFAGLAGGFAATPLLAERNDFAFAMIPVGCVLGGLAYRIRSIQWPHDATVRRRQIVYSTLAIVTPPLCLLLIAGPYGSGLAFMMIGAIVGASVACGILVSGTRRFRVEQDEG